MIETTVELPTPDGVMTTRTFAPDEREHPAAIFYMDGLGVRDSLVGMARRLASSGYFVVLPNLFYRSGPFAPFSGETAFSDPGERARIMPLIASVTPANAATDTAALIGWLDAQPNANSRRMGTVGYCMGGGPALSAAGRFPDRIAAAASYHGGRLATDAPDSPHIVASHARGRLYVGYAENDRGFPDEQRERVESALSAAQVDHTMELYHAGHGFAVPDMPVYDERAAERHWETLLALFRDKLP